MDDEGRESLGVSVVPPGHDAWVVGKDPVVTIDYQGMADYAFE